MKILVDENIPSVTVQALRDAGHDVEDIRGTVQEGISDEDLWQKIQLEKRLLITTDKGFSQRRNEPHYGMVIVRLRKPNQNKIHQRVIRALDQFAESDWSGLLVVMRDTVQSVWKAKEGD